MMHMTSAPHLLNEDRADFEHVLGDALKIVLDDQDAGRPTGPPGGSPLNAEQLRTMALASADVIGMAAAEEYDAYRTVRARTRESARESARARESRSFGYAAMGVADGAGSGAGLFAVMAVLTPLLAGAAALIFLLIGYAMSALSPEPGIAAPLRTVGWFFAAVTGGSILLGGVGLILTALRDGSGAIHDAPESLPPEVADARDIWQDALLTRGLLPFLTDALAHATPPPPTPSRTTAAPSPTPHLPRLGYSRPDFTSPDLGGTTPGPDRIPD